MNDSTVTTTTKKETDESTGDQSESSGTGRNPPSLIGRLLYGGVLIFTGLNHFQDEESMVAYSEAKGVPMADIAVPFSGGLLVFSGLFLILWRLPRLAAGAAISFLVPSTLLMHDFWAVDEEEKQAEMNNFLKNTALLGAAFAFLKRGDEQ